MLPSMARHLVALTGPELVPRVEELARRDLALHLYALGDLDPFFLPRTRFWGLADDGGALQALALLYAGGEPPTLLALGRGDGGAIGELVATLGESLPGRVYAHLSPGLVERLGPRYQAEPHGRHLKMMLRDPCAVRGVASPGARRLGATDLAALEALYASAYPGNWFDRRMLASGQYFGIEEAGALVAVAGVHVFAPGPAVAAIGNVTTAPQLRGRGLAGRATAALCRSLLDSGISTIGLNVQANNTAAIRCYQRLGFVAEAEYHEFMLTSAD